jgi:hypothetical protein
MKIKFGFKGKKDKTTYVCIKDKYTSRNPGKCPTCRECLNFLPSRWRIGKKGQFLKIETKHGRNTELPAQIKCLLLENTKGKK